LNALIGHTNCLLFFH